MCVLRKEIYNFRAQFPTQFSATTSLNVDCECELLAIVERRASADRYSPLIEYKEVVTIDAARVVAHEPESLLKSAVRSLVIAGGHLLFDGRRRRLNLLQLSVVNQRLSTITQFISRPAFTRL